MLEQCPSNLVDLGLVVGSRRAWVNTPRRSLHWYRAIKNSFIGQSDGLVMNIKATNLGIACNAIHFLDLFAWFTHSSIESLSLSGEQWYESKRNGFWDVDGSLKAIFSDSSTFSIHDHKACNTEMNYTIEILSQSFSVLIDEFSSMAVCSDGVEIPGSIPLQSEDTSRIVDSILLHEICELPSLSESIELHLPLVGQLLRSWEKSRSTSSSVVPIT